jgi:uncharacterized protein
MSMKGPVTLEQVKADPRVKAFIYLGNQYLDVIGFTDHGFRHTKIVAKIAYNILSHLGFPVRTCELASIAAYLHDLGNVVNREGHEQAGAILAMNILHDLGMDPKEQAEIVLAIGVHKEPVSVINAAVILADKSDVHRSRVQQPNDISTDIHDRVNYAVTKSFVRVDKEQKQITLSLEIDTSISDIMDYFSIFVDRMSMAQKSANFLNCRFGLEINNVLLLGASDSGQVISSSTEVDHEE